MLLSFAVAKSPSDKYEEDDLGLSQGSMLDVDAFVRIMEDAWRTPDAVGWQTEEEDFTGKPDAHAGEETCLHRGWWFKRLPFDKAIHGQLLAAIGTKAKKRKKKKEKSGSKRK